MLSRRLLSVAKNYPCAGKGLFPQKKSLQLVRMFSTSSFQQKELFTKTHEWIRFEEDDNVTMGISDVAQSRVGEIVLLEVLAEIGQNVKQGETIAEIESSKAASEIYTPISGTIIGVNENARNSPKIVNQSAENEGWIVKVRPDPNLIGSEKTELMERDDYSKFCDEE